MKSLLFIGHEFHEKTGSADFLLELLRSNYQVSVCSLDPYSKTPEERLAAFSGTYDILVCYQVMPSRAELSQHFRFDHAAFFPMADSCPDIRKIEKWYPYRDFQVICFCSALWRQLKSAGFSAHYLQFFPKPIPAPDSGDPRSAFLWARREEINCSLVEQLFSPGTIESVHVHIAPDPGVRFCPPSPDSRIRYTYSEWFNTKEEMQSKITESAYYIAPRQKEGIGMSFLEAMSMGRCVIAPDRPTMNEYIVHWKTGLLYDLKNPAPVGTHDLRAIQERTREYAREGLECWERDKQKIFSIMTCPVRLSMPSMYRMMTARFIKNPLKTSRALALNIPTNKN